MRYPRTTQRLRVIRGCVRRRLFAAAERALRAYRYADGHGAMVARARAWAQEFCGAQRPGGPLLALQNLCMSSGRKRAIVGFFQLHRLDVRGAYARLRLPGLRQRNA